MQLSYQERTPFPPVFLKQDAAAPLCNKSLTCFPSYHLSPHEAMLFSPTFLGFKETNKSANLFYKKKKTKIYFLHQSNAETSRRDTFVISSESPAISQCSFSPKRRPGHLKEKKARRRSSNPLFSFHTLHLASILLFYVVFHCFVGNFYFQP